MGRVACSFVAAQGAKDASPFLPSYLLVIQTKLPSATHVFDFTLLPGSEVLGWSSGK